MYEIDLRRVSFASPQARENSTRRLGAASVSSILPDRAYRSLCHLHLYATEKIAKLPDIPEGDLSTLASLDYLFLDEDKVEVTLR